MQGSEYWYYSGHEDEMEYSEGAMLDQNQSQGKDFDCHYCGKIFKEANYLKVHIRDIHENFTQHKCPFCEDKFFKNKNTLANHKSMYHKGQK